MSLTRPIPKQAMAVVKVLRRDVPRPPLPELRRGYTLRWFYETCDQYGFCSMGLHPAAKCLRPVNDHDFPVGCTNDQVVSLFHWNDEQTDPQALVDAIWGKQGETNDHQ